MDSSTHSQRKVFIGGNWKCNGNMSFVDEFCKNVLNSLQFDSEKVEVCICPAMVHLFSVKTNLDPKSNVIISSQNVSQFDNGAYTGEVSATMLKDLLIEWTLIGHSERRQYFGDTEEVIAKKVKLSLERGLNVIACIGEKLDDRESGKTMDVVVEQLKTLQTSVTDWGKVVIAYEPVWAIGTGKTATPDQAQEVHVGIREWICKNISEDVARAVRIIYGGSVNEKNCQVLISEKDIDGFLVGGASISATAWPVIVGAAVHKK